MNSPPQFANLACNTIVASHSNRKHFDAAAMQELAADIKARGVLSPILVRPLPASRLADTFENRTKGEPLPTHEIVFGERRWRASNLSGLASIPALVSNMTDAEALEAQLIENLQREDLSALDEAHGISQLMASTGMAIDDIAAKLSKSRRHVYNRLALLSLASASALALRKGEIDATRALLIAGIPNEKQQIKALGYATEGDYYGQKPSVRALQSHIRHNYMLSLVKPAFDTTSASLYPVAGACTTCPKHTAANPDLFASDDHDGEDLCIDSVCYHAKEQAQSAALVDQAKAKGQTVIAGKAAQELMTDHYHPKFKGYKRLDDAEDSPTDKPLRKLIGKQMEAEGITPVMIENPKRPGELVAAITNEVAAKLLKTVLGQADTATKAVNKEVRQLAEQKKKKADEKAQEKFEQGWRDALVASAWKRMIGTIVFTEGLHRYLALKAAHNLSTDHAAKICKLLDLGSVAPVQAVIEQVKSTISPDQMHMLIVMVQGSDANEYRFEGPVNEGLNIVASIVFNNTLDNEISDIKTRCADEFLNVVKAAKTAVTHSPAAQPVASPDAHAKKARSPAPLRKARLSAQDAQSGIAAAMQGLDASAVAAEAVPAANASQVDAARPQLKQATPDYQAGLPIGFDVGQRVKVIDTDDLPLMLRKYAGKVGTVKRKEIAGGEAYEVAFRGVKGGLADFRPEELELAA